MGYFIFYVWDFDFFGMFFVGLGLGLFWVFEVWSVEFGWLVGWLVLLCVRIGCFFLFCFKAFFSVMSFWRLRKTFISCIMNNKSM